MVEDKIIIHEKKSNYLLLLIGFAFILLNVTITLGYYIVSSVGTYMVRSNITFDFIEFSNYFTIVIYLLRWILNFAGTILFFIAGRKILLDKKYSVLLFVLLIVSSFFGLVAVIASSTLRVYWIFNVISVLIKLIALVFIILILIRNKIVSKLLLISIILFGVHILIQMIIPYARNLILSFQMVSYQPFDIAEMLVILNAVNFISMLISFVAIVLVAIYLIKAFVKNNIFKKPSLNKIISILLMVVPTLVVNSIIYVIYLVCLFVLTTI